ncbi:MULTISPECIES: tripartite tricarboxylate transporter TctB family protein [Halomonas]|uniref:tripartite tricarboxylate transporter TctB family protein n=1 Tax=Halomonas TaxID=2745 RepID=UPI001C983EDE|nr:MULTISPECIES: tripartite tricarboxylate transporter TctB family protein [Halomonas]MBY5966991.1 tripartite tricarboxylate transporter TctB family protein [Halomonas denitrificans]MBY5982489.1 tripartite tricarboxylate transporter TctB family protein [Halomonas sp. DP5Y7-2]MBY6209007.1 tripartite tricarboxylate transporter TctB family protein [Halomonas sp. DP3Y7-2]MBY6227477.1 tripartite tricarboxylate transporter TctB family protein [Halomonas sp. DP3Y7-1]MCA0914772.1 tripartite tricarboxy
MRTSDAISGTMAAALGAALIVASADLSPLPRQVYGAGTFPKVVGGLLLLMGGLLILKGLRQRQALVRWSGKVAGRPFLLALGAVVASVIAYVLLTPVLGFPVVAVTLLTLLFRMYHRRGWGRALLIAVMATAVIWMLFAQVLHVPLAPGLLEQVLY